VNGTLDDCYRATDAKLSSPASAAGRRLPADVVDGARRELQRARDACADVTTVTSCGACWRRYGNVVTRLVAWRRRGGGGGGGGGEPAYQFHRVWLAIDRYRRHTLNDELRRRHC